MRFTALFSLAVLGLAAAYPSEQSTLDVKPITDGFAGISSALNKFAQDLQGVTDASPAAATTSKLTGGAASILAAMKDATAKVNAMPAVTNLIEALSLPTAAKTLVDRSKEVIGQLKEKKAIIAKAGQIAETVKQLTAQKDAAQAFGDAVASKLPSAVQAIAKTQGKQAVDTIAEGIAAFA
jgi:Hydrophobic surface binding protein A